MRVFSAFSGIGGFEMAMPEDWVIGFIAGLRQAKKVFKSMSVYKK